MPTLPEHCGACGDKLDPDDEIVQIAKVVPVKTEQAGTVPVPGPTTIVHAGHTPAPSDSWIEVYRGPLRAIRPI